MTNDVANHHGVIRGYIEGYYGKLLSWNERKEIVRCLASLGLNTYCYAPKEDPHHRANWRESHPSQWYESFTNFCTHAQSESVSIIAGIAPGLDFQFNESNTNSDFDHLLHKAQKYLQSGASEILVLWDDIDDNFNQDIDISEGTAHAKTVNQLADALGRSLSTVPRVYATEIENKENYLEDFFTELNPRHTVLLCGKAIVTRRIEHSDLVTLSRNTDTNTATDSQTLKHRTVIWDNFYANDYCPRRLFIGPWTGREAVNEYLINPTGLPFTDRLILDIATATQSSQNRTDNWRSALKRHGVPDAFLHIADNFLNPVFGDQQNQSNPGHTTPITAPITVIEQAIEECLWTWKSPLAREWYPFIMSLKHDLALMQSKLPEDRILKTQTGYLAKKLLTQDTNAI